MATYPSVAQSADNEAVYWTVDQEEADLRSYMSVVSKHKWLILKVALFVSAAAAVVVFFMNPVYRSTATLLIEAEEREIVPFQGYSGQARLSEEYLETQNQILQSRKLAEQVITELDLVQHPEFGAEDTSPGFLETLINWVAGNEPPTAQAAKDRVVNAFFDKLSIRPVPNSQLIRISFDTGDPTLAAQVPNALSRAYIQNGIQSNLLDTQEAADWIEDRLDGLRANMEASEIALQEYRDREDLLDVGGVDSIAAREMQEITGKLVEARRNRAEAGALLEQVNRGDLSPDSFPAVLEDQGVRAAREAKTEAEILVSELRDRYGPMHPEMVQAQSQLETAEENLSNQIYNVLLSVERRYEVADARVSQLTRDLEEVKGKIGEINRKQSTLTALEREVENNRQLYDTFVVRLKETTATDNMQPPIARLADPATEPSIPVAPKKGMIISLAFLMSSTVMCFVAFLVESLDNTMKLSTDVEKRLHLPVLGVIPKLPGGLFQRKLRSINYYASNKDSAFSENIRTIRTNVLFPEIRQLPDMSQPQELNRPGKVILVTSSIREEGKSTVSTNLAWSLAQMEKVLLIDADTRNPVASRSFKLKYAKVPGLSNYLAEEETLENCIHKFDEGYLQVMPSGTPLPDSLELLSSDRFHHMIATLRKQFGYIVIDSPPVIPVSDSVVLSRYADEVLYIVKADDTPYQLAQEGIKRLKQVNAPLAGAVLNQVSISNRPERYGGYRHADYYSISGYDQT